MKLLIALFTLASSVAFAQHANALEVTCYTTGKNAQSLTLTDKDMTLANGQWSAEISAGELSGTIAVSEDPKQPFIGLALPQKGLMLSGGDFVQAIFMPAGDMIHCNRK